MNSKLVIVMFVAVICLSVAALVMASILMARPTEDAPATKVDSDGSISIGSADTPIAIGGADMGLRLDSTGIKIGGDSIVVNSNDGQTLRGCQNSVHLQNPVISMSLAGDAVVPVEGALTFDGGKLSVYINGSWQGILSSSEKWMQMGTTITEPFPDSILADQTGRAVTMSANGSRIGVASLFAGADAQGGVRMYEWTQTDGIYNWKQIGQDLLGVPHEQAIDKKDYFAELSISGDGNTVAIGSKHHDPNGVENAGQVKVYKWKQETESWEPLGAEVNGQFTGDGLGISVAMNKDGTMMAAGAPYSGENDAGKTIVYRLNVGGNKWDTVGLPLTAAGQQADDVEHQTGVVVVMSGTGSRVAVSSWNDGTPWSVTGNVTVYELNGDTWDTMGIINLETTDTDFGCSLAMTRDGETLAVGASVIDSTNGEESGQVRVYRWIDDNNIWTLLGNPIQGDAAIDQSGGSVSISDEPLRVVQGARWGQKGHVRVHEWRNDDWVQLGDDIYGIDSDGSFGWSVAMSGDGSRIVVGEPFADTSAGEVRAFEYTHGFT